MSASWADISYEIRACVQTRWPSISGLHVKEDTARGDWIINILVGCEWRMARIPIESLVAARHEKIYALVVEAVAQKMRKRFMRYRKTRR